MNDGRYPDTELGPQPFKRVANGLIAGKIHLNGLRGCKRVGRPRTIETYQGAVCCKTFDDGAADVPTGARHQHNVSPLS